MNRILCLASCIALIVSQEDEIRVGGYASDFNWNAVAAITSVVDQGQCEGASMCLAAVTLYETEHYRQTSKLLTLSTEYCLECNQYASCDVSSVTHQNLQGIMEWLRDNGCPLQSNYPYTAGSYSTGKPSTPGICDASRITCPEKVKLHKKHKAGHTTLKHWIAKNPCACLIYADDEFKSYTGSISTAYECRKNSPSDKELNHGITAIGYDKHTNYLVQNSYGASWGDGGYALLKKGKDCGLRKRVFRYNWQEQAVYMATMIVISLFTMG